MSTPITEKARGRWYRQLSEDQAKIEDIWKHAEHLEQVLHKLADALMNQDQVSQSSCAAFQKGKAIQAYQEIGGVTFIKLPATPP
jgi:hypothetical protein